MVGVGVGLQSGLHEWADEIDTGRDVSNTTRTVSKLPSSNLGKIFHIINLTEYDQSTEYINRWQASCALVNKTRRKTKRRPAYQNCSINLGTAPQIT
jgi:hypothetical protein